MNFNAQNIDIYAIEMENESKILQKLEEISAELKFMAKQMEEVSDWKKGIQNEFSLTEFKNLRSKIDSLEKRLNTVDKQIVRIMTIGGVAIVALEVLQKLLG